MKNLLKVTFLLLNFAAVFSQNPDFDERATLGSGYEPPPIPFTVSGTWSSLPNSPMLVSRTCCVYVEVNGIPYLYQFGGGNTSSELKRVARLNLLTNTWQNNYSTMPREISSGTAIAMNGGTTVFVFGGNNSPGTLGRTMKYNVLANTWQNMVDMPTKVTDALVVKYSESFIFVVGGGDGFFGASAFVTNKVQLYNVNTDSYIYKNDFPIPCAMQGGGIYVDTIISAGGYTTGGNATSLCYKGVINPATMNITWVSMPSYPAGPIVRMASFVAVKNTGVGIMCTGGAVGGSVPTAQTNFWNFCTQSWHTNLPDNSLARSNFKASGKGNNIIYAAGGYTNTGVGTTEYITFSQIDGPCQNMVGINGNGNSIPDRFELKQNYPNPFNPSTKISFSLPIGGNVNISVYDAAGRIVSEIVNSEYSPGNHSVDFDAGGLSSGVYIYKISVRQAGTSTSDFTDARKMVLIK